MELNNNLKNIPIVNNEDNINDVNVFKISGKKELEKLLEDEIATDRNGNYSLNQRWNRTQQNTVLSKDLDDKLSNITSGIYAIEYKVQVLEDYLKRLESSIVKNSTAQVFRDIHPYNGDGMTETKKSKIIIFLKGCFSFLRGIFVKKTADS